MSNKSIPTWIQAICAIALVILTALSLITGPQETIAMLGTAKDWVISTSSLPHNQITPLKCKVQTMDGFKQVSYFVEVAPEKSNGTIKWYVESAPCVSQGTCDVSLLKLMSETEDFYIYDALKWRGERTKKNISIRINKNLEEFVYVIPNNIGIAREFSGFCSNIKPADIPNAYENSAV